MAQNKKKREIPEPKTEFEELLISAYKDKMIAYMHAHPEAIHEALELAVADRQPYSWRSAWLLWSCLKPNDARVKKHLTKIIAYLPQAQDNQKRELIKICMMMKLTERQESKLFDYCTVLWTDISLAPGIRMMALRLMFQLVHKYPELTNEVMQLTHDYYMKSLSPGIHHSVKRLFSELSRTQA